MFRQSAVRILVPALAMALLSFDGGAAAATTSVGRSTSAATSDCGPGRAFRLGTHNVFHGTARFTPFAGIIGWQEVSDRAARRKLRRQLGSAYRNYISSNESAAAVAVSWKTRYFGKLKAYSVKTHEGKLHVSPDRWISVVHLQRKDNGRRLVVLNTHFVSEAFKDGSSYPTWRLRRWKEHRAKLRQVLDNLRFTYPGRAIVLVGDFNRQGYLDFSAQRLYRVRRDGSRPIDQIYTGVPARGDCLVRRRPMGSDHYRWRARAWIR